MSRRANGEPIRPIAAARRRRAKFEARRAAATDPLEYFAAHYDYFRSWLARVANPEEHLADVQELIHTKVSRLEGDAVAAARRRKEGT